MADDNIRKFRHGKDEDGIALPDDPDELAAELARRKPRGRGARGMLSVVGGLWREKEEQMQKIGQNAYKRAVIGNTARQAGRAARDEATGYREHQDGAALADDRAVRQQLLRVGLVRGVLRLVGYDPDAMSVDLDAEAMEEIKMASGMETAQIVAMRRKFLASVKDRFCMTKDEFMDLPFVVVCPLKNQLARAFGFDDAAEISFFEFMTHIAEFNGAGARDQKLHVAFKLQDLDGDGVISRDDMLRYFRLVVGSPEDDEDVAAAAAAAASDAGPGGAGEEKEGGSDAAVAPAPPSPRAVAASESSRSLGETDVAAFGDHTLLAVVEKIFAEASSDPRRRHLTFDDFQKVIGPTDFEAKLRLHL